LNSDQAFRFARIIKIIEADSGNPPKIEIMYDSGNETTIKLVIRLK